VKSALKKRQRWVYLLTLTNAVLIVAIAITLKKDKTDAAKNQLNLGTVNSMQWRREDAADIVFKRSDDQWQIISPCPLPVNEQRLEPMFNALASHGELYAATSVDLGAAGLESPQAMLLINEQEVAIGEKDLSGEYRYLQKGSTVTLVPEWVLSLVSSGLTGVAELSIFHDDLIALERSDRNAATDTAAFDRENLANLSANQIVLWPVPDLPEITASLRFAALYKDGQQEDMELVMTQSYAAIRRLDSQCAYLLPPDAVPDSLAP